MTAYQITEQQKQDMLTTMQRTKAYFPYRIVWGAFNPETGEVVTGATATKRQVNDLVKKGWQAWTI